ncbi:polysulfide reductase NrfD [bacterium]|nr:polysulfide reductase NrfD [bacterium]MBU1753601.1 polysulfide reductase NrfD [bacterium]
MKLYFTTINGKSPMMYVLLAILAVLAAAGLYATYAMFSQGHYITGMNNQIPWGLPIVVAIYCIGLSAGSLVISALSAVFGQKEFKPFARIAVFVAALLLVGSLLSIILDWGRPDRVMLPFLYLNPRSIFSWNGFLYSSYIFICVVYLWAMFTGRDRWIKPIGLLAVMWAVGVHSGTGAIFGFINARELYHSPLASPTFVVAALSSGTALMILIIVSTFKATGRFLDNRLIIGLAKLLGSFIIVVLYFVIVEYVVRLYTPSTYEPTSFVLFGGNVYTYIFWGGLILLGSIVPAIILFNPMTKNSIPWIMFASLLVIIGVFCERLIFVLPGQVFPLNLFPDMEMVSGFMDGQITWYHVSLPEIAQGVGILSIVAILYIIGLKLFALLPTEARHLEHEL